MILVNDGIEQMIRARKIFPIALIVAAGAAVSMVMAGSAAAHPVRPNLSSPAWPLGHAGRWLTDAKGRVLIIHGVNVPTKILPAGDPVALGFDDTHAAFIASLGFNAIRLGVERYFVEPEPGQFDAGYVGQFSKTVKMLANHGILSLIDFHQDEFGPEFCDNGFPEWMTVTDGLPSTCEGFPYEYLENEALNRAFDHLWQNDSDLGPHGSKLQDDDAEILHYVASKLHNLPGILGYEVINEPWPGSKYPTCISLPPFSGCPEFDTTLFSAYYDRMIPELRLADKTHLIWYEPLVLFNFGIPTFVNPPADPRRGFAFHDYTICQTIPSLCGPATDDAAVVSNAVAHTAETGDAMLETEFGATNDTSQLSEQVGLYDQNMIPWMFWAYNNEIVGVTGDGTLLPPTGDNVQWPTVDVLASPYPQLVSGTPISWGFDQPSETFTAQYSTKSAAGVGRFQPGSVTEFVVPAVQYPNGYGVAVTGGAVLSDAGAPLLKVAACPGASTVSVTVTPSSGNSHKFKTGCH